MTPPGSLEPVQTISPTKRAHQDAPSPSAKRLPTKPPEGREANFVSVQGLERAAMNPRYSPLAASYIPEDESRASTLPPHPRGIKPLGNLYSATQQNLKTHAGSFAKLPDELLLHALEQLEACDLLLVGATCKALHAFACHGELWKTLLVQSPMAAVPKGQRPQWHGSWRATYLNLPPECQVRVDCTGLYSDALYRPFHCAHLPLELYTDPAHFNSPISKLPNLTPHEFKRHWVHRPFILTEPVKSWDVYRRWNLGLLMLQYGRSTFRCEAVDWPLETYAGYMHSNDDESPLYLFDSKFAEKMQLQLEQLSQECNAGDDEPAYTPPRAFTPDLFSVLGDERPAHRWLIIGPPRSGSSFHTDPNGTSAWNAVLKGRKYWIMSPTPPPGVYVSDDESEVTSPSSIAEWLMGFHNDARNMPGVCEGICEAGEVLHVPGGWYHLVLNLPPEDESVEDNIAITQNFVPEPRLPEVLTFLKRKPDQVSGFQFSDDSQDEQGERPSQIFSAYDLLVSRLEEQYPEKLRQALDTAAPSDHSNARGNSVWEEVTKSKEPGDGGFSFGFSLHEEDGEGEEAIGS